MATPLLAVVATGTLLSAGSQIKAGKTAARESELTAQTQEVAATQREADRKNRLAEALATANAQAGASGIRAFEGSPLTILNQSIANEETATERDLFNTRIGALTTRARGQTAKRAGQIGAATSLLKGGAQAAQLMPEEQVAKPFQETVNIQPQTIATGQPQQLMTLSQKLDDFASFSAGKVAEKQIAQAQIQGQQAGIEQQQAGGKLELKEETFIGGISKKAFNTAAREGYLKSLDNDNIEQITGIAANNATNLAGFNDSVNSYAKSVLENVDPASRGAVELSIDSMVSRYRPKIQAAQAKQISDDANNQQAINADERGRLAQSSSFEGDQEQAGINLAIAIDSINTRTDLNDAQKSVAIREIQLEEREAFNSGELNRTYNEGGSSAAIDKLNEMEGNPPGGFTPDEWDKFVAGESKKINRRISREKKQTAEEVKAAKLAASVTRGGLFTDPDIPADPAGSSKDREDINNFYDAESQGWANLPIQEQVNLNVDFVTNTGLVPKTMVSNVNAAMRSGNVEQVALMSDFISRIQEESPASLKDTPMESRAISLQVSDAQRAGMDVEIALEQARKSAYGLTDSEKDVIRLTTQEISKKLPSSLQSAVNSDIDEGGFDTGIFSNVPDVPPMMLADYRNSFGRFMSMTGGDSDQAEKLAYDSIKSVWGVTETGGPKRFSKYAPETIYAVPGSNNHWVEDQFNEEMEGIGAEGAIIAIDKSTAREAQPSYPVFVPNKTTGILEPLRDDTGTNLTWRPEYKLTEEYQSVSAAPALAIESAKKQRGINLDKRANTIRRGIQSRVLSAEFIPADERADFMASDEGRQRVESAINNMVSIGKIDEAEAKEARNAFGI